MFREAPSNFSVVNTASFCLSFGTPLDNLTTSIDSRVTLLYMCSGKMLSLLQFVHIRKSVGTGLTGSHPIIAVDMFKYTAA